MGQVRLALFIGLICKALLTNLDLRRQKIEDCVKECVCMKGIVR